MNQTAKQRAAMIVLELMARTPPVIPHTWSPAEIDEVKRELAKIELGLQKIALAQDARACKALGREMGRQVKMRRVKGVK